MGKFIRNCLARQASAGWGWGVVGEEIQQVGTQWSGGLAVVDRDCSRPDCSWRTQLRPAVMACWMCPELQEVQFRTVLRNEGVYLYPSSPRR